MANSVLRASWLFIIFYPTRPHRITMNLTQTMRQWYNIHSNKLWITFCFNWLKWLKVLTQRYELIASITKEESVVDSWAPDEWTITFYPGSQGNRVWAEQFYVPHWIIDVIHLAKGNIHVKLGVKIYISTDMKQVLLVQVCLPNFRNASLQANGTKTLII